MTTVINCGSASKPTRELTSNEVDIVGGGTDIDEALVQTEALVRQLGQMVGALNSVLNGMSAQAKAAIAAIQVLR